jgi:hypothetical protein
MLTAGAEGVGAFTRWWVSPVHVRIGRDGVSLVPPDQLDLSIDEATALNDTLRTELAASAWTTVESCMSPCMGVLMQSDRTLPQGILSPWAMARQRFTDLLPSGPAMADWRRLWMDVQMALHSHPVNAARSARGLPAVNAYWWWGGGAPQPQLDGLRVHAKVTDLATGSVDATQIQSGGLHRMSAWLGRLLAVDTPGSTRGTGKGDAGAPSKGASVSETQDPVKAVLHVVDNAHAGLWFAPGSAHPLVQALDTRILAPLAMAAAPHELVLTGQSAWRSVASSAALRLAIWKQKARVEDVVETVDGLLDEGDLARAWQDSAARATPDDGEFHPDRF